MIRQKNIHIVLAVTLLVSFAINIVEAGSKKRRGTAGAQELLIPTGSRGTAMAGAYVAGISGLEAVEWNMAGVAGMENSCLLYTSPSPRDRTRSRMPSSA